MLVKRPTTTTTTGMASAAKKVGKVASKAQKVAETVIHPPYIKATIGACQATAAPPLGPALGQRGIQIATFCKQFNDQTANIKPGVPIPTVIRLNPDRTISLQLKTPSTMYFLKMAAGAKKLSLGKADVAGIVTLKHIYEIAKIKSVDEHFDGYTLEEVCKFMIGTCHSCGIKIVTELDAEYYAQFLEERKEITQKHLDDLEEKRQAKMLRL